MRPNILKLLITLPYFLNIFKKSNKWFKKVLNDPNLISEEKRYLWIRKVSRYILWLHNVKIHTLGKENWKDGPIFLAPNHQSNLDGPILFALNNFSQTSPCAFLAKAELQKNKRMYKFLSLIDVVFIERNNLRQSVQAINEANELIKTPRSMVIFPEGTRNPSNETLGEFKDGAFKLAQKAYVPIVPITIFNSFKALEGNIFKKKHVYVIFHKSISPDSFMHMNTAFLSTKVKNIIQSGLNNIESLKKEIVNELKAKKIKQKNQKIEKNKYGNIKLFNNKPNKSKIN